MSRAPYVSISIPHPQGKGRITAVTIVERVLAEVRSGHLPSGARLPPVRELERRFGMSKNTAQAAYEELVARGAVESREREGYFVCSPPLLPQQVAETQAPALEAHPAPSIGAQRVPEGGISLSTVFVDPDLLPRDKLEECARSVLRSPRMSPFYDVQGYPPLRRAIASRLSARGIEVTAEEVVITTGSQQALDMVARASKGARVAVESPTYGHAKLLFESLGREVVGLPLDPFAGPDLDRWQKIIGEKRPGFVYTITSFQNPTGYSYTTSELMRLLEIARASGTALVEDDWGSDFLSGTEYRPMLRQLGGPNVVYVNSFTKKLMPSLRVGFLVAAPELVPTLVAQKRLTTLGNAWLTEAIVAEFLERGYYDAHLATMQAELDRRYEACLEMLRELMPDDVRFTTPGGGPTLWLELPETIDFDTLEARTSKRGVFIERPAAGFVGEEHLRGFRVSYAFAKTEALRRGLAIVAEELALLRRAA